MVSSHGSTSWQLRRVTSRLSARPGGFVVLTCVGRTFLPLIPRTWDCFVNLGTNRFDITANIEHVWGGRFCLSSPEHVTASVDICGRMKELGVPDRRSLHLELLRLTVDSTRLGGKGGGEV